MGCNSCHGKGTIINNPCTNCKGSGTAYRTQKESITIPKGINTG